MIKKLTLTALLATAFVSASVANAATVSYQFGNLLSGSFTPSGVFATLDVTTTDNITYDFTLTNNNLNGLFTGGAFVGSMLVDSTSDKKEPLPSATLVGSGNGIISIDSSNGGGPGGDYDFRYVFGGGDADRLEGLEVVSWTSTFMVAHILGGNAFALHVQGLTENQGGSAFYTPGTPLNGVPVPASLPLMASALGLFGVYKRRNSKK